MCSGKSENLYKMLNFAKERKEHNSLLILPFKHDCANGNVDETTVISRSGVVYDGDIIRLGGKNKISNLNSKMIFSKYEYIGFDESQFFQDNDDEIYNFIAKSKRTSTKLIFAGLDLDFKLNSFETMNYIMLYSDMIFRYSAICQCCKSDFAIYSKRSTTINNDNRILIDKTAYYPTCRKCYHSDIQPLKYVK